MDVTPQDSGGADRAAVTVADGTGRFARFCSVGR